MGIRKLLRYITSKNECIFSQIESGNSVYISNIIYYDLTYKLIDLYNAYLEKKVNEEATLNENVYECFKYIADELKQLFTKMIVYNRVIYCFLDYRIPNALLCKNILFKDFISVDIMKEDKLNSISMIKRKHIAILLNDEIPINDNRFKLVCDKLCCMFELTFSFSKACGADVRKYIGVPYLIKKYGSDRMTNDVNIFKQLVSTNEQTEGYSVLEQKLLILKTIGILRYQIIRGGKLNTKLKRRRSVYSFFSDKQYVSDNINKTLMNTINDGDEKTLEKWKKYMPFSLVMYGFPLIIKMINVYNVYYLGCGLESDFAIAKHIRTYSKTAFPTIYTNDTDLIALLSDISCIIKLNVNGNRTLMINPVEFWGKLFGYNISSNVIKLMCILLGTDYNPYDEESPIHKKSFKEILKMVGVKHYKDIDEDALRMKIYEIMFEHPNNKFCQQTALSINIYFENHENNIYYLTNINPCCVDVEKYLKMIRKNMFGL